ncbi:MAG TPA: hypothetical protein VFX39_05365 [Gemmatimonadaceae bacterium]|nr:hypothetical protein [Gemmatimonadaceae bacterium]
MKIRNTRPTLVLAALAASSVALATGAAPARAQDVGHTPENSPYRDIPWRHQLTAFTGYYAASKDPAGVAPRSGPLGGVRYDVRVGGPAQFYARLTGVSSERMVLDPRAPVGERELGTKSLGLFLADVGLALNLTGQKSWNSLVPVLSGGVGVVTDFDNEDIGSYKLGTPFALSLGTGVRWVPGGRFQLRVDITDHLFQIRYPSTYFQSSATPPTPLLEQTQKDNVWKHNAALTIGASYLLGR